MIKNDFKCLGCGEVNEHTYSYEDKASLVCPVCDADDLQVLLGAPSIKSLNNKDRIQNAVKKRSTDDHKKYKDDRLAKAKEKYKGFF